MTVNQTIRQTRKVIAYFRQSVVQKWGQGQTAPWVYGRFELYNNYRVCGATRPPARLSFGKL